MGRAVFEACCGCGLDRLAMPSEGQRQQPSISPKRSSRNVHPGQAGVSYALVLGDTPGYLADSTVEADSRLEML